MVAIFTPIYDRVLTWSRHRHAERYLMGMSMAESIFFPIPPDVMLAPMVLANRARAWWLAGMTTLASVIGGVIGYLLGYWALELIMPVIERAGYVGAYDQAVEAFESYGIWFVILAGFSPIPFKLITIAAGALGMPWLGFVVGSVIGRASRFYMVAGIIYAGGERAAEHLRSWVDRIGWAVVGLALVVALLWLTGCASTTPAPVVHRSGLSGTASAIAPATYTVRAGDSLYSIAFRYGLDWQEVAAWNGIQSPYVIRQGDELRLRRPVGRRVAVTRDSRSSQTPRINETRPLSQVPSSQVRSAELEVRPTPEPKTDRLVVRGADQADAPTRRVDGLDWQWPLDGAVVRAFDPSATRRGLGINGAAGDVVVAAADGEVVYSGTALIGYGELVIIKHSPTLLSAYGYNSKRLVDEGMRVEAGAPIAEVGQNTDGRWQLHFEVRRNGDAVDPRAFLPSTNQ